MHLTFRSIHSLSTTHTHSLLTPTWILAAGLSLLRNSLLSLREINTSTPPKQEFALLAAAWPDGAHLRHSCTPNCRGGSVHWHLLLYVWTCHSVLAFKCPADPYLTSVPVLLPLIGQVHKHNYQLYWTVHNRIQTLQTTPDCHTLFSILYTRL
jgi:hypothetical protein